MRTRLTNLERQMAYALFKVRPVIKRKVDAGACVHDILVKDEFEYLLRLIDGALEETVKIRANEYDEDSI